MKKILWLAVLLTVLLCGCGSGGNQKAESLTGVTFQLSEDGRDYDLFFVLQNKEGEEIASSARVKIRIEDELGTVLYDGEKKITESDFDTYEGFLQGEHYFARVQIPVYDILPGKSTSGTVYFEVSKGMSFSFKNLSCEAAMCLPIRDIAFDCGTLPRELILKDPFWHSEARYRVDQVSWISERSTGSMGSLVIEGVKTAGAKGTGPDMVRYQITSSQGKKIQGGELYLGRYDEGDPFKADIFLTNLTPGEKYIVDLSENEE